VERQNLGAPWASRAWSSLDDGCALPSAPLGWQSSAVTVVWFVQIAAGGIQRGWHNPERGPGHVVDITKAPGPGNGRLSRSRGAPDVYRMAVQRKGVTVEDGRTGNEDKGLRA